MRFDEAIDYALAEVNEQPSGPPAAGRPAQSHGLSRRELEVLRLIARGKSNQQMADELVISVRTVERHINHIYEKIDAHNKAQATAFALGNGLA